MSNKENDKLYDFIIEVGEATGDTHLCDKLLKELKIAEKSFDPDNSNGFIEPK